MVNQKRVRPHTWVDGVEQLELCLRYIKDVIKVVGSGIVIVFIRMRHLSQLRSQHLIIWHLKVKRGLIRDL